MASCHATWQATRSQDTQPCFEAGTPLHAKLISPTKGCKTAPAALQRINGQQMQPRLTRNAQLQPRRAVPWGPAKHACNVHHVSPTWWPYIYSGTEQLGTPSGAGSTTVLPPPETEAVSLISAHLPFELRWGPCRCCLPRNSTLQHNSLAAAMDSLPQGLDSCSSALLVAHLHL